MARKPDDAFIERVTTVGDSISTATSEQVEKLVGDAQSYGADSVEMLHGASAVLQPLREG